MGNVEGVEQTEGITEHARRLETAAAREIDALALASADLTFVISCCDRILADQNVDLGERGKLIEDKTYQRALWDAALVAFYKHAERPGHASVRRAMDAVLASANPNARKHFENWRQERHKRIAHPVGKDEAYRAGVFRLPGVSGVVIVERRRTRVGDDGIEWFRRLAQAVLQGVERRIAGLQGQLQSELDHLTDEEYRALPALPLGDHRRPPGVEKPLRPLNSNG